MGNTPVIITEPALFSEQEKVYLHLREKEGRIYTDEMLKMLPVVPKTHPLAFEWKVRKRSSERLSSYLSSKQQPLKILELGCGNGWLSNKMSEIKDAEVTAIDINMTELNQAARVFGHKKNIQFLYADIFQASFSPKEFDVIIVASVLQYFPEPKKLINRLLELITKDGELHILDSPLYEDGDKLLKARERSANYFKSQDAPLMRQYYFHHSKLFLKDYSLQQMKPTLWDRITGKMPFPWTIIKTN